MGMISRSLNRNKFPLRKKKIWSCVMIAIILICCYFGIFHSHRYFKTDMIMLAGLVGALSVAALDFIWFNHDNRHRLNTLFFLLLVGGSILLAVIYFHKKYVDSVLQGHEVPVKGVVTKLFVKRGRGGGTLYAVFNYTLKGKQWTQKTINSYPLLVVGDTVNLWCSDLDPTVFVRK